LIFCREEEHINKSIKNNIFDEVHVQLDVFVVLILRWIFGDIDGTMIVAPKDGQMLLLQCIP
jgi:hypothetical protein